ncbi:DUF4421 family protein [Chitinophaga sp. Cy-1792]|uniref:DUF4421 family protein n=1 Tax=Chitinophaga sp. Cy-1792 TaxID=2608339 RepID=UPI00141F10B5|nr:DUF4421 family protein [Chitinophaga sp. Cy-1792]NIG56683.1 DUF4421 domain-containing protein [Chitinophaga sp. Cy-1792]
MGYRITAYFSFVNVLWLLIPTLADCQSRPDSSYLRPFLKRNMAEVYTGLYYTNFNFTGNKNSYQLRANSNAYIGADVSYKWLYVQLAFNIPGTSLDNRIKFKYQNYKFRWGNHRFVFQPYYQSYNGLLIPQASRNGYDAFRGIDFMSAGLDCYYFVNASRFSHKAGYAFSEDQTRSAGSLYFSLSGIWNKVRWPAPSKELITDSTTYALLSANPEWISVIPKAGYAYNLVHHKWLLAPTVQAGAGALRELNTGNYSVRVVTELRATINGGYNGDNYYIYLSSDWYNLNTHLLIQDMQRVYWTLSLTAGMRFKSLPKKILGIL